MKKPANYIVVFDAYNARTFRTTDAAKYEGIPNVMVNPVTKYVNGIPQHHWAIGENNTIIEKSDAEKAVADTALATGIAFDPPIVIREITVEKRVEVEKPIEVVKYVNRAAPYVPKKAWLGWAVAGALILKEIINLWL